MPPLAHVLAIDVGTQSARAALVDREGRIADSVSSGLRLFTPRPGWAEQSPHDWWRSTALNVSALLGRNPGAAVDAVAVAAQMHGVVPLDGRGRVLAPRVGIWSDKRAAGIARDLAGRPEAGRLAAIAGNRPLPAWAGLKMAWFGTEAPDVHRRTATFLVVKDFLNFRLTGVRATDPSEASGTWLLDWRTGRWSDELLDAVGLARERLPDVADSTAVIGGVTPEAAARTGLRRGTPVVCGGGDMLCQLLAAGVTRAGRACEVSGTASIIAGWAEAPSPDPRLMNLRTTSGGWARFGIADAGGESLRWFVDRFWENDTGAAGGSSPSPFTGEGRDGGDRASRFELLVRQAAAVPAGSGGLLFFPYLLGERTLGSSASRGSIVGLTPGHGRPEMLRAILEGICLELRRSLEPIAAGVPVETIRVTGGGATSQLWNQVRADVYGVPVVPLADVEGGIQGAAILAGTGAGWFSDPASAVEEIGRLGREVRPDPVRAASYDRAFAEFCAVHDLLDGRWPAWGW